MSTPNDPYQAPLGQAYQPASSTLPSPTRAQPYPAQPYATQSYPAQPYPAQPYPAQPYATQPYPVQAYASPEAYAYGGYAAPVNAKAGTTNGFAVAALVLGALGGTLLAVIFAAVALNQIKKNDQQGRGMAIAGAALGTAWFLLVLAINIVGALNA